MVERVNGFDTGMLAGETPEWHMHTGALVLLEPVFAVGRRVESEP